MSHRIVEDRFVHRVLAAVFALFAAAPAHALSDRSFESGLGAWVVAGDALVDGSTTHGAAATDGVSQLLLTTLPNDPVDAVGAPLGEATGPFSGTDAVPTALLESSLGVLAGEIAALSPSGNAPVHGSGVYQDFSISDPSTLTFDWNFITNEIIPTGSYTDFVFWLLMPSGGGAAIAGGSLADTNGSTFVPSPAASFDDHTGYQSSFSYDIATPGSYRLAIGVVDVLDDNFTSAVLLDDFRVVPEPSSALLVGLGLVMLGLRRSRT
jgi:hypothetical protein